MSWALVLGGVGTSALAWHAGLLAALQTGGADVTRADLIVGTSAGAITAARIACGLALDEAFVREREACAPSPRDLAGLAEATDQIRRAAPADWPDRPLQITALELGTRTVTVWTRSTGVALPDAVEASCAFAAPGQLKKIKGRSYLDAGSVTATSADLAFGHRLVVVIAAAGPHGPLDDEVKQLRAGGSYVRLLFPDAASSEVLARDLLRPARRTAAAEAGYAQGLAVASAVGEWLRLLPAQPPEVDVEDLAARFAVPSLRRPEWTHVAHLAVGAWHVDRYGASEALVRLRDGIRRLNVSIGGQNTESSGYHETITAAYVTLLAAFLDTCPGLPLPERVVRLLAGPLADRDMLFTFYSRERLFSNEARARWMDPDRAPLTLDTLPGRTEPA